MAGSRNGSERGRAVGCTLLPRGTARCDAWPSSGGEQTSSTRTTTAIPPRRRGAREEALRGGLSRTSSSSSSTTTAGRTARQPLHQVLVLLRLVPRGEEEHEKRHCGGGLSRTSTSTRRTRTTRTTRITTRGLRSARRGPSKGCEELVCCSIFTGFSRCRPGGRLTAWGSRHDSYMDFGDDYSAGLRFGTISPPAGGPASAAENRRDARLRILRHHDRLPDAAGAEHYRYGRLQRDDGARRNGPCLARRPATFSVLQRGAYKPITAGHYTGRRVNSMNRSAARASCAMAAQSTAAAPSPQTACYPGQDG